MLGIPPKGNEQVALYNQRHLRDYTGIGTLLLAFSKGCLRYSPLFCKDMKLGDKLPTRFIYLCKPIFSCMGRFDPQQKIEFSTSRRLAGYPQTPRIHYILVKITGVVKINLTLIE